MADTNQDGAPSGAADADSITFSYVKSTQFRVIHADGAVVSVGPNRIFFSLYSERLPIPQAQTFEIVNEQLGPERDNLRVVRKGVVREVEVGVSMSLEQTESLIMVLQQQVQRLKAAVAERTSK